MFPIFITLAAAFLVALLSLGIEYLQRKPPQQKNNSKPVMPTVKKLAKQKN